MIFHAVALRNFEFHVEIEFRSNSLTLVFLGISETAFIKYPKYSFKFAVIVADVRSCVIGRERDLLYEKR